MTSTGTRVELVAADAGSSSARISAGHDVELVVPARPVAMTGTRSGFAAAEKNSAGVSTVPADMLSAVADGSAVSSGPRYPSRKPTCYDAYRQFVDVGELARAENGS